MEPLLLLIKKNSGQLLIEALMGFAIASIVLPALFMGFFAAKQGKVQQNQRIQAIGLMKEAEEVVRSVREKGWDSFAANGVYYPEIVSNAWSFSAGSENINGFTRTITISDVSRDDSGAIVSTGGKLDPSTKKVDIKVSWGQPYASETTSTLYITRYLQNSVNVQTTFTDFTAGIASGTAVLSSNGGEVKLGVGGGGGDWCIPVKSITTVDLSRQGVPTDISAYVGNIVTGTGENASGPTFVKIGVSGNTPPNATILGQVNNAKANGVFTENNFGYIATTNNGEEIQIIDLTQFTDPPTNSLYKKVGYFNAPGNTQGNSIYVSENKGYITAGNKFYIFDLSSHTGSRPQLNPTAVTLAGTGNRIVVEGGYAYIVTSSTSTQIQIVDVNNPAAPVIVASANVGNSQPGIDVVVNSTGTRAYLVTSYASTLLPDFYILDTSNKSGSFSSIGAGFNTNVMNPEGLSYVVGNKVIIVGTGGSQQYQVINITNENSPTYCGGISILNGAYGISSVLQDDGYAFSYVVTGDAHAELKMILGGAGGQYAPTGLFTSKIFDAVTPVVFNYFKPTYTQPDQTNIRFQVSVANPVNGNCDTANFDYVGPDGTQDSFFTSSEAFPVTTNGNYSNPGKCMRYKAYFSTSNFSASPTLHDVTVNYSP